MEAWNDRNEAGMAIEIEARVLGLTVDELLEQIEGRRSYGGIANVTPLRDHNAVVAMKRAALVLADARDTLIKILEKLGV